MAGRSGNGLQFKVVLSRDPRDQCCRSKSAHDLFKVSVTFLLSVCINEVTPLLVNLQWRLYNIIAQRGTPARANKCVHCIGVFRTYTRGNYRVRGPGRGPGKLPSPEAEAFVRMGVLNFDVPNETNV